MKKIVNFILMVVFACSFLAVQSGCEESSWLLPYVSELKKDIYVGDSQEFNLKAYYGYKESPYASDGKIESHPYTLTFLLLDAEESQTTYFLTIPCMNDCRLEFTKNNTGKLVSSVEIEDFNQNSFDVKLQFSSQNIDIKMHSIVPENCLDIDSVLKKIQAEQSNLINNYVLDSKFDAEIYARVIVKDDKAYWYVAFASKDGLKAFLVDGVSGEVLAIREVF